MLMKGAMYRSPGSSENGCLPQPDLDLNTPKRLVFLSHSITAALRLQDVLEFIAKEVVPSIYDNFRFNLGIVVQQAYVTP